jgi:hypothetical protein
MQRFGMQSFSKAMRGGVSAVSLALVGAVGLTTAAVVAAPAAYAQAKTSKEFGQPFTEARTLIQAKNYAGALPKIEQAAPHAKSPAEKLAVEQLRTAVYAGTGNKQKLITSLESQIAIGGLPAETVKTHKRTILGLYSELGNDSKALQLTKDYLASYGGESSLYAFVASNAFKAKNYGDAIEHARKAIDQARKEGKRPDERWFNIEARSYFDQGKMNEYYDSIERAVAYYPKADYWKALATRAEKAPKFNRIESQLDLYRALKAAGVQMSKAEQLAMGEAAFAATLPVEAETYLKPLADSGDLGGASDKNAERNKRMWQTVQAQAKTERAGGIEGSLKEAAAAKTGDIYVGVGEAFFGLEQWDKAIDALQKGLAKGGMNAQTTANAQLHLGIAQYRAGQKDAARKTWAAIKSDNGAQELARMWTLISQTA